MARTIKMQSMEANMMKYAASGPSAAQSYATGVARCTNFVDLAASDASEANWKNGVAQAAAASMRSKGIKAKVTNQSWIDDCKNKGAAVIGQRINGAAGKYSKGYAPVYAALNGMALPDKQVGDPIGNLTRIAGAVVRAEVNVKRAREGLTPI